MHHFCPHPFFAFLTRLKSPVGFQCLLFYRKNPVTWLHLLAREAGKTAVNSGSMLVSSRIHLESCTYMCKCVVDIWVYVDLQISFRNLGALAKSKMQRMGITKNRSM